MPTQRTAYSDPSPRGRFTLRQLLLAIAFFGVLLAAFGNAHELGLPGVVAGCCSFGAIVGVFKGHALSGAPFGLLGCVLGVALAVFPVVY